MKKFLPFSRRQPSLDRFAVQRGGWSGADRFNGKSMRRISATSLNTKSIQVVRGAYNIDLNKVDSSFTKLHRACLLNDDAQVKKHIHKVDNNSHDSSNRYPIHLATVNGNFAIVKLLIENSANPNVRDNEGYTPLVKSIECGHEHLVKYLLNNGADPNIVDSDNNTALHWAILTESIIAIDALISSKKCDLSLRNNKDETCLHVAVRCPLINTVTFESMIRGGSDLLAKDQLGLTAFEIAQACNNKIAINAFNRCQKTILSNPETLGQQQEIAENINQIDKNDQEANVRKMCDDYKQKYITKNRENLEYEKRLIQLNAQIERMKLDMSYMKEQNEKLEDDYEKLSAENSKLKQENASLLDQIATVNQQKNNEPASSNDQEKLPMTKDERCGCDKDTDLVDKIHSVECRSHEEFLVARAYLQEQINESKFRLSAVEPTGYQ